MDEPELANEPELENELELVNECEPELANEPEPANEPDLSNVEKKKGKTMQKNIMFQNILYLLQFSKTNLYF